MIGGSDEAMWGLLSLWEGCVLLLSTLCSEVCGPVGLVTISNVVVVEYPGSSCEFVPATVCREKYSVVAC